MANVTTAIAPSGFTYASPRVIQNAIGTALFVIADTQAAAAGSTTANTYFGGASVLSCTVTSTDTTAAGLDLILYQGKAYPLTTALAGVVGTTATTITRTTGDFIADGWRVGDQAVLLNAASPSAVPQANEGVLITITTVAALTLTASAASLSVTTVTAGTRLVRVGQLYRTNIPPSSGNAVGFPNVEILQDANDRSLVNLEKKLGTDGVLLGSLPVAVTATKTLTFNPILALY